MASAVMKFSAILLLVSAYSADVSEIVNSKPVTEECLGCICEYMTGCQPNVRCERGHCGIFWISRAYWADAGKPTLRGQSPDASDAYLKCVNDPYCASKTVQGYMRRYGQDCNGDNRVDCYDYMAIHRFGASGCTEEFPSSEVNVFNQCMAVAQAG